MSSLKNRVVKATALTLALAVTHICLSADIVRAASSRLIAGVAPQGAVQGRLTTRGNNSVTVNGNSARSGETIFSGQSIQTPEGVGATVTLPGLGRVDIGPNSNVTVSFEAGKINVTVASGCAVLTSNKGTAGTLEAGGRTQQSEAEKGGTLDTCENIPAGAAALPAGTAAGTTAAATTGGLFGLGTAGTVGFIAAAGVITAAAIVAPCRRGPNPSPGVPRGRNDECRD
jgi:hypothetical protein